MDESRFTLSPGESASCIPTSRGTLRRPLVSTNGIGLGVSLIWSGEALRAG